MVTVAGDKSTDTQYLREMATGKTADGSGIPITSTDLGGGKRGLDVNATIQADVNTDGLEAAIGTPTDAAATGTQGAGAATEIALSKAEVNYLIALIAKFLPATVYGTPVDVHLGEMLGYPSPGDVVGAYLLSQLPYGATFVRVSGDGAAGAAVTVAMPAVAGKINYVLGYFANVDTAATTSITTAILKDDTTVMGTKVLNAAAPVGAEVGTTPSNGPIMVGTVGKAANLVVSAPGGSTVMHACIWGYVL
jgi:hypothetical protein